MWRRRGSKYGARKVERHGYSFSSQLEAAVHDLLTLRLKAGEIDTIELQSTVSLTLAGIKYIADFVCTTPSGERFWVEAKGVETAVWRIKRRLWKYYGPGPLEIWMGSHVKPRLIETIIPKEISK